ncbi:MAG: glycosyl transferase family protein [Thermoleophilia bacterium]|nr:glycosyl transferase family protein [Thermoleophilia bacterium]
MAHIRPLILQPDSEPYGACRALLRSIQAMPDGVVKPVVVFPYAGAALAEYRAAGCDVYVMDLAVLRRATAGPRGLMGLARAARSTGRALAELAAEQGCELIHTNSMTIVSGMAAAKVSGLPHAWQLREAPRERGLRVHVLRHLLRRADLVVAISAASAAVAAPVPVQLVHDGYDAPEGAAAPRAVDRINGFTIGMVGRISATKSQHLAIEALGRLVAAGIDARLLLAGAPYPGHEPYVERLVRLVERLDLADRVDFLGWQSDPTLVYAQLDALLIATGSGEGFGGVALEAMAHGVPVVSSATGGIDELVTDGQSGLVAAPDDVDQIANALTRIQQDPALVEHLRAGGYERVARFTTASSGRELLAAWRSMVGTVRVSG